MEVISNMVSIVISFYERLNFLKRCLDCLSLCVKDFDEVVVTDDGSCRETVISLKKLTEQYDFPIKHVWQEKKGFRPAAARNQGALHAGGDYLIFLDCDFLALPKTIKNHLKFATPGKFIAGGYKNMDEKATSEVFQSPITEKALNMWDKRIPEKPIIKTHRRYKKRTLLMRLHLAPPKKQCMGGHFSIYKKDLERVNGYDENFVGWGGEDEDMGIRLVRAGIYCRSAIRQAKVLHMWHPPAIKDRHWQMGPNIQYFNRKEIPIFCENGLLKPKGFHSASR